MTEKLPVAPGVMKIQETRVLSSRSYPRLCRKEATS